MRTLLLAVVLSLPPALHAQEEATSAEAPAEPAAEAPAAGELGTVPVQETELEQPALPDEPAQLDELVVTAQKIKQPLRKVPLSVTALDGDFVGDVGAADLADVSLYVPNVRVDADDLGSPQIFIRGFGTNAFNPSFEGSVAFVQDEIYFGRPGYFTEAMFDVDRIEVLRGPQGTLFGKNSVAGVFSVTSRSVEDDFNADVRLFRSDDAEKRYEGGVGGMVTDWLGGRASVLRRAQDGELRNTLLNRLEESLEQDATRVKLVVLPGAGVKSELTAVESETHAPFWPFQLLKLDDDTRDYVDDFDPAVEDDPKNFRTSFDTPGFIEKGSETVGLRTEWDVDELGPAHALVPVLVIGVSEFYIDQLNELDVSPADISRLDSHEDHEQASAELRVSGRFDSLFGLGTGLEFLAGGFYYESDYVLLARVLAGRDLGSYFGTRDFAQLATGDLNAPGTGVPLTINTDGDFYQFDYTQAVESQALFVQTSWYLTERWAVTPGLRYNQESKRIDTSGIGHCQDKGTSPCFMQTLLEASDYSYAGLTRDETDLSPKMALQYFSDHGLNYYVSYARGFKSGGFNSISLTGNNLEYEPEEAVTWEGGLKGRLLDGTLSFNLTYYQTEFENLQVLAFNGLLFDVSNAAAAESEGFEGDFQWISPWEPLRIFGSFGLLEARYVDYPGAPAPISQGIGAQQNLGGQDIAFAPKETGTLTPTLTFLFGDFVATLAGDVLYQGAQYTDTDLDPNTFQEASTKYAARLMVTHTAWGLTAALGGTNLTDERTLNQVVDAPFFPGTYFAQQAGGRQLFGSLSLAF